MRFLTSEVAAAVSGDLVGPDVVVDGATIDSRVVRTGQLFVPVVAERDGHDFVAAALAAGATAYLSERPPNRGTAVVVADTARALADLGRAARRRLPERVIGVTGSVGKTSVKDLLASSIGSRLVTAASERSFNNELGVPLTLVGAPEGCEAAVVEMGARGAGHIELLCSIARPTIGVVTAVGHVHTETFGTLDDVAAAKAELVVALPISGTAVLNADDERVAAMAGATRASVLRYGTGASALTPDVVGEEVALDDELRPTFVLRTPWGSTEVRLGVRGVHQVSNALAAAAGALAAGVPLEGVATGLAGASLSPWRMELGRTPAGTVVVNDSYNANPISVAAALRSLAALPARRRIAVLGTMAELGGVAETEHRRMADLAGDLGIEVVAVGEPRYGVEPVGGIDEALDALGPVGDGDAVLIKGSRVAGLERLAQRLLSAG